MASGGNQKTNQLSRSQIDVLRNRVRLTQKFNFDCDQTANIKGDTTESFFPRIAALLPQGNVGPHWPGPDQGTDGLVMLDKLFYHIQRLPEDTEGAGGEGLCGEVYLWHFANLDLKAEGRAPWESAEWEHRWKLAVEDYFEEEENAYKNKPGRKPTAMTFEITRIREALNVSKARAYAIYAAGTALLDQRVKLAKAFQRDPKLNSPSAWELDFGRSFGGSRRKGTNFRNYVLSEIDAFEDAVWQALEVLKPVYIRGELPPEFSDFRVFVDAMAKLDIALQASVALWDGANAYGRSHPQGN